MKNYTVWLIPSFCLIIRKYFYTFSLITRGNWIVLVKRCRDQNSLNVVILTMVIWGVYYEINKESTKSNNLLCLKRKWKNEQKIVCNENGQK